MQTTISRWGNSLALRLPSHVTKEARLVEGVCVDVEIDDGSIRITPTRKRFKLAELIVGHTARNQTGEVDWGKPEGEEIW
ncbi:MAG: transcriptional regulator/antitoxin, MazE [Devosia sp.]|nr:transcriptional regulator/antitoxin, MazE [Devosia sp.]